MLQLPATSCVLQLTLPSIAVRKSGAFAVQGCYFLKYYLHFSWFSMNYLVFIDFSSYYCYYLFVIYACGAYSEEILSLLSKIVSS